MYILKNSMNRNTVKHDKIYTEKNVLLKITMFYCNWETDSNS